MAGAQRKPRQLPYRLLAALVAGALLVTLASTQPRAVPASSAQARELGHASLRACTPREAEIQGELVQATRDTRVFGSACPSHAWLPDIAHLAGAAPVIFDVGCNKAYDAAMFHEALAPQAGFSRPSLGAYWESQKAQLPADFEACGVCSDCREAAYPPPRNAPGQLTVYCFEPAAVNYAALERMHPTFFNSSAPTQLILRRQAVGNRVGEAAFSASCAGEKCSLQPTGGGQPVQMTTVDAAMAQLPSVDRLFILKTDTEGFDPLALEGAEVTLSAQRVDVLLFEYHSVGVWGRSANHTLKAVTARLASFGYVCYLEGSVLARITGCWHDSLELRWWSNVVCAIDGSRVHRVLAAYSMAPFSQRFVTGAGS